METTDPEELISLLKSELIKRHSNFTELAYELIDLCREDRSTSRIMARFLNESLDSLDLHDDPCDLLWWMEVDSVWLFLEPDEQESIFKKLLEHLWKLDDEFAKSSIGDIFCKMKTADLIYPEFLKLAQSSANQNIGIKLILKLALCNPNLRKTITKDLLRLRQQTGMTYRHLLRVLLKLEFELCSPDIWTSAAHSVRKLLLFGKAAGAVEKPLDCKCLEDMADIFWGETAAAAERAADSNRDTKVTREGLADIYQDCGEHQTAVDIYEQIIEKERPTWNTLIKLAYSYLGLEKVKLAVATLERSIPLAGTDENLIQSRTALAVAYLAEDDYDSFKRQLVLMEKLDDEKYKILKETGQEYLQKLHDHGKNMGQE